MPAQLYYFLMVVAILMLMSWSLYLPYRARQLYFVPVACMSIAAYFSAFAAREWDWPFVLVLILGVSAGVFVAFVSALVIGNAPMFATIIVGLSYVFVVKTVIDNLDILGSTVGFFGIPRVEPWLLLLTTYVILIAVGLLIYRFDHSYLGRAAAAVFVDKEMAVTLGIDIKRLGILLQTAAGGIGGITGVIYAFLLGSIRPEFFAFNVIATSMCTLFVGGYTTMWGVVICMPILWGLPLLFAGAIAEWRLVFYGALLIVVLMVRPEGLITRQVLRDIGRKIPLLRVVGIHKSNKEGGLNM